jgi:DNA-binding transcriptional MerR regulator
MTLFRCFALICALIPAFVIAAEEEIDEANLMDEAAVMKYLVVNQRTVRNWTAEGHLKPVALGGKVYYTKKNVEEVKKGFAEAEKLRLDKANEQLANDSKPGGSTEISRKQQIELREKEKRERGAGASTEERSGVENQVDYRQAELEARRKEAEAIKNNRGGTGVDDRKAERDAALKQREAEKNAKRL